MIEALSAAGRFYLDSYSQLAGKTLLPFPITPRRLNSTQLKFIERRAGWLKRYSK